MKFQYYNHITLKLKKDTQLIFDCYIQKRYYPKSILFSFIVTVAIFFIFW